MTAHQILIDTRGLLVKGWTRGGGGGGDRFCLAEAIWTAAGCWGSQDINAEGNEAMRKVAALLPSTASLALSRALLDSAKFHGNVELHMNIAKIVNWNDNFPISKDDVLAVMDKAILATAPEPLIAKLNDVEFVSEAAPYPPLDPPLTIPEDWTVKEAVPA